jgi:ribonuclease R
MSKDPFLSRETRNYKRPIPSREYILEWLAEQKSPQGKQKIAKGLGLSDDRDITALSHRLRAMVRDGQLICNRRGAYGPASHMDLVKGRVSGHKDGFGFLIPDAGGDDLFLSARQMRRVFHGDRVLARVTGVDRRGRLEGGIAEILERNTHSVVGRFMLSDGSGVLIPDNSRITQDILIPPQSRMNVCNGQIVVAEIVLQPDSRVRPVGRITEVLGENMAPGMEVEVSLRSHAIPFEWPEDVEEEVEVFRTSEQGEVSDIFPEQLVGRKDLRRLPLVTIDGEDARDFDDAVFCKRRSNSWRLVVAIADVSAYVESDGALDAEALNRGNSVYFPDRVVPMLPESLSNDLCSLVPDRDRLALVCDLSLDLSGKVIRSQFYPAVIHSHARLTYNQVADWLSGEVTPPEYVDLLPCLHEFYHLYQTLRSNREQRGAIDFESRETRIAFDQQGKIERIQPVSRNVAHTMIEEAMLLANCTAARFLQRHKMPALYRVHSVPPKEKLTALITSLKERGLTLNNSSSPTSADYAALMKDVADRPDAHFLQTLILRSLSQAVYTPENQGHFGLSYKEYLHFTSPIRRYPDLLTHRAIHHIFNGGSRENGAYTPAMMLEFGERCSMTERRADEATRDVVDWLKCEYMSDKLGQEFPGTVVGVTSFGLFVELNDVFVEGLVHVTALKNDYYHFDPVRHRLSGERSGKNYGLTDALSVKVARVDMDERKIDFVLSDQSE